MGDKSGGISHRTVGFFKSDRLLETHLSLIIPVMSQKIPVGALKILLVQACARDVLTEWIERYAGNLTSQKANVMPLGLATIAAVTKPPHEVHIWDEVASGPCDPAIDSAYDLIGIFAYGRDLSRAREIAATARARGIPVVIGGPGITSAPQAGKGHFDAIFIGEGEETWPRYLADWEQGRTQYEYRAGVPIDLSRSPLPRWECIGTPLSQNYRQGAVFTSSGCPYNCEFCDAWVKFGRRIRTKPVSQVLEEVAALHKFGMKRVLFCSDNFVAKRSYAKKLLSALAEKNAGFSPSLLFSAEVTLDVGSDQEMLTLFQKAQFHSFIIGIESPNRESLKEIGKISSLCDDPVQNCRNIAEAGVRVVGSLIAGFDHDGADIFPALFNLIQKGRIPIPTLNLLRALDGTRLYDRLIHEGRIIDVRKTFPGAAPIPSGAESNILPKRMTREELLAGHLWLMQSVCDWVGFAERAHGLIDCFSKVSGRPVDPRVDGLVPGMLARMETIPDVDLDVVNGLLSHVKVAAPAFRWEIAYICLALCFERHKLREARPAIEQRITLERQLAKENRSVFLPMPSNKERIDRLP